MLFRFAPWALLAAVLIVVCPAAAAWAQTEPGSDVPAAAAVADEATAAAEAAAAAAAAAEQTETLLQKIGRLQENFQALEAQQREAVGQEQVVVALQLRSQVLQFVRSVDELVADLVRQREAGVKHPVGFDRTRALVLRMDRSLPEFIDKLEAEGRDLRNALADASEDVRANTEQQLQGVEAMLDQAYLFFLKHLDHRESLGLDSGDGREQLSTRLGARASRLAGRVELLSQRRREARQEAESSRDDASLQAALRAANEKLDAAASSLWTTCDIMDELGLETAAFRTDLIRGTGQITGDVLNVDVVVDLLRDAVASVRQWLDRRGPSLLARFTLFTTILAVFWLLGRLVRRFVERMAQQSANVSELSRRMLVGTASRTVMVLGFFVALSQIGVNVTALLAGLGIAGFIVGFALQDTLGNFASGAMILFYRPFDVGDVIEAGGVFGSVHGMSLVSTTILTFDNQTLVVPNSKIWGDVIRNVTAQQMRRVDLEFGLASDVDVARAEEVLAAVVREHPKVLEDPPPLIKVHKLTESTTQFIVRPWVQREDYWDVFWDLTRAMKLRLEREKLPLGIPQREVRLRGERTD